MHYSISWKLFERGPNPVFKQIFGFVSLFFWVFLDQYFRDTSATVEIAEINGIWSNSHELLNQIIK